MSTNPVTSTNSNEPSNQELKKIEQEIVSVKPNIFKGIPEPKKKELLQFMAVKITTSHSGPLPTPEDLGQYNQIIPNGADRIMKMAENQQEHRMAIEKMAIGRQTFQSQLGQIFGFLLGVFAIGVGGYCIINNHEVAGGLLGGGGLTGLVSLFVIGRKAQQKSLKDKN